MTPNEEIRQAAATLRNLGSKAIAGPWYVSDDNLKSVMGALGESVASVHWEDPATPQWIATMSPRIARPLAALMEDSEDEQGEIDPDALTIARQVNSAR